MKKALIIGGMFLFLLIAVSMLVSAEENNSTKSNYTKCLKDCLTNKSKAQQLCVDTHKNETRACVLQKLSCDSGLRVEKLNKTINVSQFTQGKKQCSKVFLNCSKASDAQRKSCHEKVKDTKCEKQCKGEESCKKYYWFDNQSKECDNKKFCGSFMYEGLNIFETKKECKNALLNSKLNSTAALLDSTTCLKDSDCTDGKVCWDGSGCGMIHGCYTKEDRDFYLRNNCGPNS